MIELIGLIVLAIMQGLHVYHDYLKFKAHANEIEQMKVGQAESARGDLKRHETRYDRTLDNDS